MNLQDRSADTLTANIDLLRSAFKRARIERPFQLEAIVVLPDHLHTVMTLPEDDADYPLRWRRIKTLFTQSLPNAASLTHRDRTGRSLWQRRFWEHAIRDPQDLARHIDYIHINPVKHGLVQEPSDWPFSSLHRHLDRVTMQSDITETKTDTPPQNPTT